MPNVLGGSPMITAAEIALCTDWEGRHPTPLPPARTRLSFGILDASKPPLHRRRLLASLCRVEPCSTLVVHSSPTCDIEHGVQHCTLIASESSRSPACRLCSLYTGTRSKEAAARGHGSAERVVNVVRLRLHEPQPNSVILPGDKERSALCGAQVHGGTGCAARNGSLLFGIAYRS